MKKFNNITDKQLKAKGVQALSDRPNASAQYGVSNLSPAQLKLWFDRLAIFLAETLNDLQKELNEGDGDSIRLSLGGHKLLDPETGKEINDVSLADVMRALINGELAKIFQVYPSVNSFKTSSLEDAFRGIDELMSERFSDAYYDGTEGVEAIVLEKGNGEDVRVDLRPLYEYADGIRHSIYELQEAPPLSDLESAVILATPTLAQIAAIQYGKE